MVWLKALLRLSLTLSPRTSHKIDDSTAFLRQDQTFMKQVNVHRQTVGETHFPSNRKSLYKVHFACVHLFPMLALGSGFGATLCNSPQGHLGQERRGTRPSWSSRPLDALFPHPTLPGSWNRPLYSTGDGPAYQDDEVGIRGLADLYLREESHHQIGRRGAHSDM